jgi:exodeoxyribonuclease V beta subunit
MEHLDFAAEDSPSMQELISTKLKQHGFETHWLETVSDAVSDVLCTPLDSDIKDLRLRNIRIKDRLNELEFEFPLKPVSPKGLQGLFEVGGLPKTFPESIGKLQFVPTQGFMKGFIDLVFERRGRFYLVDWKSNFLGVRPQDYAQDALREVMQKEYYILQYHIYTLALDQYLRLRLPGYAYERDFGGVYYVFMRGVDPAMGPDFGIYRDLPSPDLVAALREGLLDH